MPDSITQNPPAQPQDATKLERARRRVRLALRCAEDGLLDHDTMDSICTALTSALRDLDELRGESSGSVSQAA